MSDFFNNFFDLDHDQNIAKADLLRAVEVIEAAFISGKPLSVVFGLWDEFDKALGGEFFSELFRVGLVDGVEAMNMDTCQRRVFVDSVSAKVFVDGQAYYAPDPETGKLELENKWFVVPSYDKEVYEFEAWLFGVNEDPKEMTSEGWMGF